MWPGFLKHKLDKNVDYVIVLIQGKHQTRVYILCGIKFCSLAKTGSVDEYIDWKNSKFKMKQINS